MEFRYRAGQRRSGGILRRDRYYLWSTADEDNPFKDAGARSESMKERLEEFQTKYGITIKYVESTGGYEWYALPRSSAAVKGSAADNAAHGANAQSRKSRKNHCIFCSKRVDNKPMRT